MIDWRRIEGFEWDAGNEQKSSDKHGVSKGEAEQVFLNYPLLVFDDAKHSMNELRFHALGRTNGGRHLQVTFTVRQDGTRLRVISARPMNRKETAKYEQSSETDPQVRE
jgi:uncharacterized DUF497 family protein